MSAPVLPPPNAEPVDPLVARVAGVDRSSITVLTPTGSTVGHLSPALRNAADPVQLPTVGDWVELTGTPDNSDPDPDSDSAPTVVRVLPRRTLLERASASPGSSARQLLAANVDVALLVEPLVPAPKIGRLERLLALSRAGNVDPEIVLTKADAVSDPAARQREIAAALPGFVVHLVSAVTGQGLDDLLALARPGVTLALLGPSGAGKSTLGNALLGDDALLPTGQVRADGKGRHTTVRRELTELPSGAFLLDTPGLRSIALTGAVASGLDAVFDDLVEQVAVLAESCRFRDCLHEAEPGCAIRSAVESGDLSAQRLERWRSLRRETAYQASREDKRLAAERQAQWKRIHRELRRSGRSRP